MKPPKYHIGDYVEYCRNVRGEIIDHKYVRKTGTHHYKVDFSKTYTTGYTTLDRNRTWWIVEESIQRRIPGKPSFFQLWIRAIKRLIKNITGHEFNRKGAHSSKDHHR